MVGPVRRVPVGDSLAIAALLALGACGSKASGSGPTPLPAVEYLDGGLLTAPKIVSVTFAGDSLASDLQTFGETVTSSAWWNTVRSGDCEPSGGACVGDGTSAYVAISTAAARSYTDSAVAGDPSTLQQWLAMAISTGQLPAPGPGSISNTVYVLYFPPTTTVTLDGSQSCQEGGFDAYHAWMKVGSQQVPYAVIVECAPVAPYDPSVPVTTLLQNTTLSASHEILETSTDPIPPTGFALDPTNTENWGWIDVTGGGELADMCVDFFGLNQDQTSDGVFTAQRMWSISRAAANEDPCVPVPAGEMYFNAAPQQSFFVLDVGESATFAVDAFSYQAMDDWTLIAEDDSDPMTTYLSFSIAGGTQTQAGPTIQVNDHSTVEVTVTLVKEPGALETGEADGLIVSFSGDPAAPTAAHFWPIAVMSTADAVDAGIPAGNARHAGLPAARRTPAWPRPLVHRRAARTLE
jgi:hypothetical protein